MPNLSRWLLAFARLCFIIGLLIPLASAQSHPPQAALAKIDAWLLQHLPATTDFIVVLNQRADLGGLDHLPSKAQKGQAVYHALWHTAQDAQRPLRAWLTARGIAFQSFYIVNALRVTGDQALALELAQRPDVERLVGNPSINNSIEQPTRLHQPAQPNSIEAGVTYIHAPEVWAQGVTGQGIVIGGQDTGYQWDHPALKTQYRGWDGAQADHNYHWHDSIHVDNPDCPADSLVPCDDYGHGTHVIGTAVGDDGGSNQIGVAPGAQWIGCRNMNEGNGTPASYIECLEFFLAPYPITGTTALGDPARAPDVTVNSWGCPVGEGCPSDLLQQAFEAQRAAGIMSVASVGNEGPGCSTAQYPGGMYDAVYAVGALLTSSDQIAGFSSRGPVLVDGSGRLKPDISAPGTGVRSSYPYSTYLSLQGTSMAAPHVAGAVALLWSARPPLRHQIDLTENILNATAVHIAAQGVCSSTVAWPNNVYGYGRVDVLAAVNAVPPGSGAMRGIIRDALTAAPVEQAAITATTGTSPTLNFRFHVTDTFTSTLSPGEYTLTVDAPGYNRLTLTALRITNGVTTSVALSLTALVFPVEITATPSTQTIIPGATAFYTITIRNADVQAHTLTITLPAGGSPLTTTLAVSEAINVPLSVTAPLTTIPPLTISSPVRVEVLNSPASTTFFTLYTRVRAKHYAAEWNISPVANSGAPGQTLTYTAWLTNSSETSEAFTLTISSQIFSATFTPTVTALLPTSATLPVTLTVTLPTILPPRLTEQLTLTARAHTSPTFQVNTNFTATFNPYWLYLPNVRR